MKRQTILVVDADRSMVRYYSHILAGTYSVLTASTGRDALNVVRRHDEVALVAIESRLPDSSGLAVLREIKEIRPAVPVILVTGYGDEETAVKAFRYGAKDYMRKPVIAGELMARMAFCLSLRDANKNYRRSVYHDDHGQAAGMPLHDIASRHHPNIRKALQFVDNNFMAKISLAATAEKACLSRHHFSRAFKRATSVTFQEYVTNRRVRKAKELLEDPRRTITEIAHFVGYNDINNLVRNFKKLTGLTPSEFRNRHILPSSERDPRY